MAAKQPEVTATEVELKRRGRKRLIGAITLGLLAIVFLPMIFDSEPKRGGGNLKTQEISLQVPAKEGQPPLAAPSPAQSASQSPSHTPPPAPVAAPIAAPIAKAESAKPAALVESAAKPAANEPPKQAPVSRQDKPSQVDKAPKAAPAPARSPEKSGFVVQLGVFSSAENAQHAIEKMKDAKLPVYTESIPIKSGTATRVRVGPYPTREKADAAVAQIKLAGADGKIVPLNN
jgi:DedD protein